MTQADLRCRQCWSILEQDGRRDRRYCSGRCKRRAYYVRKRNARVAPHFPHKRAALYNIASMALHRVSEPASPADLALAIRREFRYPFHIDWLPPLCARSGCVNPLPPFSRKDRAFCSNACRQRAYRHARRSTRNPDYTPNLMR